jgi:signal transduction histidine kinase
VFDAQALSALAHALRTPLSVIVGYSELLRTRDDEATRAEASARINDAARALSLVIDDVLTVAAIESGTLEIELAPLELEPTVAETIRRVEETVGAARTFTMSADGAWPAVVADAEYLPPILTNLLLNAVRMSPEGGEVRVSVTCRGRLAEISITDSGAGLAREQLEHAFERFAAIPSAPGSTVRPSGLELYKARRLVELQGGSIAIESEPGGGSTVRFTIPLAEPDDEG